MELIIFPFLIILVITYLVHAELFFRKLSRSAPNLYKELGSPSVIGKRQNALPIVHFFTSRDYKKLEDKSLVRIGDRLVLHFIVVLIGLVAFLGLMPAVV